MTIKEVESYAWEIDLTTGRIVWKTRTVERLPNKNINAKFKLTPSNSAPVIEYDYVMSKEVRAMHHHADSKLAKTKELQEFHLRAYLRLTGKLMKSKKKRNKNKIAQSKKVPV